MFVAEGLDRVAADHVGPGEVMAVAGLQEIMIGETIADAQDPHPLPVIKVDDACSLLLPATGTGHASA